MALYKDWSVTDEDLEEPDDLEGSEKFNNSITVTPDANGILRDSLGREIALPQGFLITSRPAPGGLVSGASTPMSGGKKNFSLPSTNTTNFSPSTNQPIATGHSASALPVGTPDPRIEQQKIKRRPTTDAEGFTTPVTTAKKVKTQEPPKVPTKNAFDSLPAEASLETPEQPIRQNSQPKKEKIPPVILREVKDWPALLRILKKVTQNDNFSAKLAGETIRVVFTTATAYRQAVSELIERKQQFSSYQLNSEKFLKIIIRGIHKDTPREEIFEDLTAQGIPIQNIGNIKQLTNKQKGIKYPLFMIELQKTENSKKIFQITNVLGLGVKIENYRKPKGVSQCFNCQRLNHNQSCCHNTPRCVKCAGDHPTKLCPKKREDGPAKCVNCGQEGHPASYRGCIYFRKAAESRKIQENLSFAQITAGSSKNIAPTTNESEDPIRPIGKDPPNTSSEQPDNSSFGDLKELWKLLKGLNIKKILTFARKFTARLKTAQSAEDKISILMEGLEEAADLF